MIVSFNGTGVEYIGTPEEQKKFQDYCIKSNQPKEAAEEIDHYSDIDLLDCIDRLEVDEDEI